MIKKNGADSVTFSWLDIYIWVGIGVDLRMDTKKTYIWKRSNYILKLCLLI